MPCNFDRLGQASQQSCAAAQASSGEGQIIQPGTKLVLGRLTHSSTQAARKLSEEDLKLLVAAKEKEAKEKAEGEAAAAAAAAQEGAGEGAVI